MRIPFLILCLAVVYGTCRTHGHEETIDLTEEIQNNGDYKMDYANMPLEGFLSRHRRASLLSPITAPIEMVLRLFGFDNSIISTAVDLVKFVFGALVGQEDLCPKIEKLSFGLITQAIQHPYQTFKTVVCYIFQAIGKQGRILMGKVFDISIKFLKNIFLPGLHTMLNTLNDTKVLPPQISALIVLFNLLYNFLQMTGYLSK